MQAYKQASRQAGRQASKQASEQVTLSRHASIQANKQAGSQAARQASKQAGKRAGNFGHFGFEHLCPAEPRRGHPTMLGDIVSMKLSALSRTRWKHAPWKTPEAACLSTGTCQLQWPDVELTIEHKFVGAGEAQKQKREMPPGMPHAALDPRRLARLFSLSLSLSRTCTAPQINHKKTSSIVARLSA